MTRLHALLPLIVASPGLHAKWLNTLSFLENCGARKIAAFEHPTLVKEEMLKHAAEEFRHAHYLKRQIIRVSTPLKNYAIERLLGGASTLHYLTVLEVKISRYLKSRNILGEFFRKAAYLLITYAIELRAEELYTLYDALLRKTKSKVRVKSIFLEEKEHLQEMREGLLELPSGEAHARQVQDIESTLFRRWLQAIEQQLIKESL